MTLYVLIVNHTLHGSRGPERVEPVCGVYDTLEQAQDAIKFLISKNNDITFNNFEINGVEINKIYYEY